MHVSATLLIRIHASLVETETIFQMYEGKKVRKKSLYVGGKGGVY